MLTFFGLLTLVIPFLLILLFKNKLEGFLYIFPFFVLFQTILAVTSQFLGFFIYPIIISINILLSIGVLFYLFKNRQKIDFSLKNISWVMIVSLAIASFQIFSLHYSYTGTAITINGPVEVENFKYMYPFFSDEWVTSSLIKYSIDNNSLPVVNSLIDGSRQYNHNNFLLFYHSLFANITMVLNINPVSQFAFLPLIVSFFVFLLVYVLLRLYKVSRFISSISILTIPYITVGTDIPGIWYLMPFIVSYIMLVASIAGALIKNNLIFFVGSFLSLLLYPPNIVFLVPVSIIYLFIDKKISFKKIFLGSFIIILPAFLIIIFNSTGNNLEQIISRILSLIIRDDAAGGIRKINVVDIIPYFVIALAFLGLYKEFLLKRYYIISATLTGFIFWYFYSGTVKIFIIEYPRIVIITAFFVVILYGLGLQKISDLLNKFNFISSKNLVEKILKIVVILFVIYFSFSYPKYNSWDQTRMILEDNGYLYILKPVIPINYYLNEEDLKLFEGIKGKRFISQGWKGLVIGASTGNYPLYTKSSTISNRILNYDYFKKLNCKEKKDLIVKHSINYIYTNTEDKCEGLDEIGISSEGFILYKTSLNAE